MAGQWLTIIKEAWPMFAIIGVALILLAAITGMSRREEKKKKESSDSQESQKTVG